METKSELILATKLLDFKRKLNKCKLSTELLISPTRRKKMGNIIITNVNILFTHLYCMQYKGLTIFWEIYAYP